MKLPVLLTRAAPLTAIACLAVSCKNKDADMNPYANNPGGSYYGPGAAGGGGGDFPDVQPTPPSTYGGGGGGYTAPPPANNYGGGNSYSGGGGGGSSHTVVKGDTLFGLSRKYGTTVGAIKSANGLNSDNIRIGQTLHIP